MTDLYKTEPFEMVCDPTGGLGGCPACWPGVPWAMYRIGSVGYRVGGRVVCFRCIKGRGWG